MARFHVAGQALNTGNTCRLLAFGIVCFTLGVCAGLLGHDSRVVLLARSCSPVQGVAAGTNSSSSFQAAAAPPPPSPAVEQAVAAVKTTPCTGGCDRGQKYDLSHLTEAPDQAVIGPMQARFWCTVAAAAAAGVYA